MLLLSNFGQQTNSEVNPNAITIAEEVSGMPGLTATDEGGYGFDYRMAEYSDFWIRTIKEKKDEEWLPSAIGGNYQSAAMKNNLM